LHNIFFDIVTFVDVTEVKILFIKDVKLNISE